MILSDRTIYDLVQQGVIGIEPWLDQSLQPASVDVHLGSSFLTFRSHDATHIDPLADNRGLMERIDVDEGQPFVLHPQEFALGSTLQYITLPDNIVARIEGKSSLGRLGLLIHTTAGFIDPGWSNGQITLELVNVAPLPIKLWPGMKIAQLAFTALDEAALRPYGHPSLGSKYQGQTGPVASSYHKNYDGR